MGSWVSESSVGYAAAPSAGQQRPWLRARLSPGQRRPAGRSPCARTEAGDPVLDTGGVQPWLNIRMPSGALKSPDA